ncbi:hypothetical protein ABK040_000026 [Willaertia magna]
MSSKSTNRRSVSAQGRRLNQGNNYNTSHSIPTRFETKLNFEELEKKGFGTSSRRFPVYVSDLIGPTASTYEINREIMANRTSYSSKGYGPTVSNSKRWYEEPRSTFNPPGPGQYKEQSFVDEIFKDNRAKGTPQFITKENHSIKKTENPHKKIGPGTYDTSFLSTFEKAQQKLSVGSFTFKSASKRFTELKEEPPPPPPRPVIASEFSSNENISNKPKELPSAIFRSKTFRETRPAVKESKFAKPIEIKPTVNKDIPGPGAYNPYHITQDEKHTKNISHFFKNGDTLDRFGTFKGNTKGLNPKGTPGPNYLPKVDRFGVSFVEKNKKRHISSSFFISNTTRDNWIDTNKTSGDPGKYDSHLHNSTKTLNFHSNQ